MTTESLTYNHAKIEADWQTSWQESHAYDSKEHGTTDTSFYCLAMLPYPSGDLHMGHIRNYTLADVIARYQSQHGQTVMQPMGWDAFGLPAENAALKHQSSPYTWTKSNIARMRAQLQRMGYAIDWQREISTCDPSYYRWEQWLFLQLYKKGLAYKKSSWVNWDPVDQTVLANEQVVDGCGWRSGAPVEKKRISQWFFRITAYADELLSGLDTLDGWPHQVKEMQRHWIGQSTGCNIHFNTSCGEQLTVYTTRVDTLMGSTFLAIAADHPMVSQCEETAELKSFLKQCQQQSVAEKALATQDKIGFDTGITATHPLTGETLPVWITNYVLMGYGHGAVMAVPAHDERDHAFALQYGLPIKQVIQAKDAAEEDQNSLFTGDGILVQSGEFNGLSCNEAKERIAAALVTNESGETTQQTRLRDWGISRQRYWGTPIPMIMCDDCGLVPVPESDLPVVLPTDVQYTDKALALADMPSFYECTCPQCGKAAKRDTDTMDTFVESSWYYARYCSHDQHDSMLDDRAKFWTPVNQYIGGVEHAVMHLLYARFFHKVLRDEGLMDSDEPFTNLLTQGMVLKDGNKMSKSKGNVVAPTPLIERYGADTVRLFIIFAAPPTQDMEWSDSGVEGAHRFLNRVWQFMHEHQSNLSAATQQATLTFSELDTLNQQCYCDIQRILSQAGDDMRRQQLNTVVSAAMKLFNLFQKHSDLATIDNRVLLLGCRTLLLVLAPITPHICVQLWQLLALPGDIFKTAWPTVDVAALELQQVTYVVQVNGKRRGNIAMASDADKAAIEAAALSAEEVQKYIADKTIRRVIVVPKKLVNIVV